MVALNSTLKKAYWALAGLGGLYVVFLLVLTIPYAQRNFLYLNKVKFTFYDIEKPEKFGFAKNQITPFHLTTSDDEILFGWHVLPQGAYLDHRDELLKQEIDVVHEANSAPSFDILRKDPEARLIVFFHGNAGTVGQGWRPDAYRNFIAADSKHAHVLSIDYRGFGHSTGSPSETGLILDAKNVLDFAMKNLNIAPSRIVVVGHSLGSAVATGVLEQYAREEEIEFGGIVLISSFTSLKKLILNYSMAGILPILGPLRPYPFLQDWFTKFVKEPWDSGARLRSLAQHSRNLRLVIIHAYLDPEILWTASSDMYNFAINGVRQRLGGKVEDLSGEQIEEQYDKKHYGDQGWTNRWRQGIRDNEVLEQVVLNWGGHNQILTASMVGITIRRFLNL